MKNFKYQDWYIWLLVILIIFQIVIFVNNKEKFIIGKAVTKNAIVNKAENNNDSLLNISFYPEEIVLKESETKEVSLVLKSTGKILIGGADIVLKFNPEMVKVVNSPAENFLPSVVVNTEKGKTGELIWTFLDDKGLGKLLSIEEKVLSLTIKGVSKSESEILLLVQDKGATTVFVENGTGKKIFFKSGKLKVSVN